jgi:hypothetical protein
MTKGKAIKFTKGAALKSIRRQAVMLGGGAREAQDYMSFLVPNPCFDFGDLLDQIARIGREAAKASRVRK